MFAVKRSSEPEDSLAVAVFRPNPDIAAIRRLLEQPDAATRPTADHLKKAAMLGHVQVIALLFEFGAPDPCPALFTAAQLGRTAVVAMLLDRGVDVNCVEESTGMTPLARACSSTNAATHDQLDVVRLLLDRGADINLFRTDNECDCGELHGQDPGPPLAVAAQEYNASVVRLLLERGADVNVAHGLPLQTALQFGQMENVTLLLDHGARIEPEYCQFRDIWSRAIEQANLDLVRRVIDAGALDADAKGICAAAQWGKRYIAEHFMSVYEYSPDALTATLISAISWKQHDVVDFLIAQGIEVTGHSNGPLSMAVQLGEADLEMVRKLIGAGAKVTQDIVDTASYNVGHEEGLKVYEMVKRIWDSENSGED